MIYHKISKVSNDILSKLHKENPDIKLDFNPQNWFIAVWTTTPWTMPGNRAVSYNKKIKYSLLVINEIEDLSLARVNDKVVVAKELIDDFIKALEVFDGAMVGRAAYSKPFSWRKVDSIIYKQKEKCVSRSEIIKNIIPSAQKHLEMMDVFGK